MASDVVYSLKEVASLLDHASDTTCVVFDCDDVLTTVPDLIFKPKYRKFIKTWCEERGVTELDLRYFCDVLMQRESFLVEKEMPQIVHDLQMKGARTLVLTGLTANPLAQCADPLSWRIADLARLGLSFGGAWKGLARASLSQIPVEKDPSYAEGVILSGFLPKSDCLGAFLDYAQWMPQSLIFIDDKKENVEDIANLAQQRGIEYHGIYYLGADLFPSPLEFSEARAQLQLDTMLTKGTWLSDEEADKLLKNKVS